MNKQHNDIYVTVLSEVYDNIERVVASRGFKQKYPHSHYCLLLPKTIHFRVGFPFFIFSHRQRFTKVNPPEVIYKTRERVFHRRFPTPKMTMNDDHEAQPSF